jgi:tetratricopeptide (TPR) repeat protein
MSRRAAAVPVEPLARSRSGWIALACAAIVLAVLAAYSDSFRSPFIFDDEFFVTQRSAQRLWPIWPTLTGSRPVVPLTLALNCCLGGSGTTGYHVFNVAVHLLAALTLFGVIRRTLRLPLLTGRFDEKTGMALAFCAALIWALHPLQTGAVTYIIQRMESLMALFYLVTLYCFIRAAESPNPVAWHVAAIAACTLGMGSKEVMVSAPLIVLLYDRTFVAGSFREALRRRWGLYVGLAATWLILARSVLDAFGPSAQSAGFNLPGVTSLQYAQSELGVILHYLRLAFWPVGLCLDYDWPIAKSVADIAPGAIVVGFLLAATVWALVRRPMWGFAGALFFLVLAPTSSIMPIKDLAFEHRMYLPLTAVTTVVVVTIYLIGRRLARHLAGMDRARRLLALGSATALISSSAAALGTATWLRNADYRTAISIWQDTAFKRPENSRAWSNLAHACISSDRFEMALWCSNKAIKLKRDYADAYDNRGVACANTGHLAAAVKSFENAIAYRERFTTAYEDLIDAYLRGGHTSLALSVCNREVAAAPDAATAWFKRGLVRFTSGDTAGAVEDYEKAIALDPEYAEACYNLAGAFVCMGRPRDALRNYNRAIDLRPSFAQAYCDRASVLNENHQFAAALRDYDKAISLDPDFAIAWHARGNACADEGRYTEALRDYEKAIGLQPKLSIAYKTRAMVYFNMGQFDKAWADVKTCENLGDRLPPEFLKALAAAAQRPK